MNKLNTDGRRIQLALLRLLKKYLYRFIPRTILIFRKFGLYGVILAQQKKVMYGPFKGMRYAQIASFGSSLMPKFLGSYEEVLHSTICDLLQTKYERIINIGCGEGYYAVGLALIFKNTPVDAFDTQKHAVELTKANLEVNGLTSTNLVRVENTPFDLNNEKGLAELRALVVCDIEGAELNLFDDKNVKNLQKSDLIVELHDFIDARIKPYIIQVFSETHHIQIVQENKYVDFSQYPFLKKMTLEKAIEITNEYRPSRMEWAILRSLKYYKSME